MKCPKLAPTAWFLLVFGIALLLHLLFGVPVTPFVSPLFLQIAGIILLLAALTLNLLAIRAFKKHRTTHVPFSEPTALIDSGVFGISRHPVYLALVLAFLGLGTVLDAWIITTFAAVLMLVLDRCVIAWEEEKLETTFGEPYRVYQARVGRWIGV